jgi:hypothetical protein
MAWKLVRRMVVVKAWREEWWSMQYPQCPSTWDRSMQCPQEDYSAFQHDRLFAVPCELADYRKIHGHCNVPQIYKESSKLAN